MEQYIKIKAKDDEGNPLGTFRIYIEFDYSTPSLNSIVDSNKEIHLDGSIYNIPSNSTVTLYNVPIVYEFDNETPIQFYKNSENNINIMLLEERKYYLSFKPSHKFKEEGYEAFYSLLKFTDEVLEIFPNSPYDGNLLFGSYVGKSYFDIYKGHKSIYKIPFEVRSRKLDYVTQYAAMIGDLSRYSQNLIYESSSPLYQSFELDSLKDESRYEDFMLLEYLFKDENLPSTIEYLSRNLYSALTDTQEEVPTSFASNINPNDLIDVFSNSDKLSKSEDPNSIWTEKTRGYVPLRVNETKYIDDIDVPENRFYKNFLESLEYSIIKLYNEAPEGYIKDKLFIYKENISAYLSQRFFKDISMMDYVPLNSQLLQKKEGYRDILQYYLMLEFGFRLNWDEITNQFKGNEKKVFDLYEYWCYFELVDILNQISINDINFDDLFFKTEEDKKDNFTMILKKDQNVKFDLDIKGKPIKVDLRYNTPFNNGKDKYTSYSVLLKPDYSLIIHDGEKKHILHFDAKYKLSIYDDSFKNEDVVKMHAYKDAILDTVGAYVLYPGDRKRLFYEDMDNKLESVGAFPLSPGENKNQKEDLKEFIVSMLNKLI